MNSLIRTLALAFVAFAGLSAHAQVAVTANANHAQTLASADAKAAANKRLAYDFWRKVFEAGQLGLAEKYMTEGYIQHNPTVPAGRPALVEFFGKFMKRKPVEARVKAPLVAIVAERDLVILSFVREAAEPKDPTRKYTTTWFDMFRIENGKIAEHWDPATKR
jgi:predicted SnoaL-like aldol condensation-catalyzing enzyme